MKTGKQTTTAIPVQVAARIIAENQHFVSADDRRNNPAKLAELVLDRMNDEALSIASESPKQSAKILETIASYKVEAQRISALQCMPLGALRY